MFAELINSLAKTYQSDEGHAYHARPSMAGPERCIRAMTYHALGVEPAPFPGRALLTFDDSSWHEELTIQWHERSVLKVHSRQMPVDLPAPGINPNGFHCGICEKAVSGGVIHGHIDWIVQPPVGDEYLVEHKALSHFGCQRIEKGELPLDYLVQACIYSAALQRVQPDLRLVNLLIKNKNTAQYIEFEMVYDAAVDSLLIQQRITSHGDSPAEILNLMEVIEKPVGQAIEKFREIESRIDSKTLPKRPFEYGTDFPCGYCRWGKTCWENYDQEFAALSTDVALSDEIATAARFYKELGAQESEIKEQRKEINSTIKAALRNMDAKAGKAGEYLIELKRFLKKEFTVPASMQEKLTIIKLKGDTDGLHQNKKQSRKGDNQTPTEGENPVGD